MTWGRTGIHTGALAGALALVATACGGDDGPDTVRTTRGGAASGLAAQSVAGDGGADTGIVVRGRGVARVDADRAIVVLGPGGADFDEEAQGLTARDRLEILTALKDAGFADDAVDIDENGEYGGAQVTVEVEVASLPDSGERVETAVESVTGRVTEKGVFFALSDCGTGLGPAIGDALEQARAAAQSLAAAADVRLGDLESVTQTPVLDPYAFAPVGAVGSACDPDGWLLDGAVPYDAEPRVSLPVQVVARFAIDGAPDEPAAYTAEGSGSVTVEADQALIVVGGGEASFGFDVSMSPAPDPEEIVGAIVESGIARDRVEIDRAGAGSLGLGSSPIVTVAVDVADLPEIGEQVADAVERAGGWPDDVGVRFGSSRCAEVLGDAQRAALIDAGARLDALAAAAGAPLGPIVALVTASASDVFAPVPGPCDADAVAAAIAESIYGDGEGLADFDDAPRVTISASVAVTRARG